ncbi:MAG TPA: peptidylprolyl isomerase [Noviherbaspirillum sp.]|nr:peptidylprolyl isomerase [Noviherbaspirillum sp.]
MSGNHAVAEISPAETSIADLQHVVARVNGRPISRAVFDELVKARAGVPNPYHQETPEEADERHKALQELDRAKVIENLVVMEVLAQKAREQGLHTRPDIAAEAELQYKSLLQEHLVRDIILSIEVTQEEILARYEAQEPEKEYKIRHILLDNEAAARSVIAGLNKGTPFAVLARKHSVDKRSRKNGSLGWLMLNQMVEPFAIASAALRPGEHTQQPVQTRYGWHVIRVDGIRDLPKPTLDDMRMILRTRILQEKVEEKVGLMVKESRIEVVRPDIARMD